MATNEALSKLKSQYSGSISTNTDSTFGGVDLALILNKHEM